jgi:tetratricopeptide (TPR) repeat protein
MRSNRYTWLVILFLGTACAAPAYGQAVRAWRGTIDIPTYLIGEEDPAPIFPLGRHRIYPYTMLDDLTDKRETKTYRTIFLENEYLKATILPDVGGRLYSLYDKTDKREVFYRNNVMKYGLVGLRGAWISGGIEFNFPDGHTVVTVSPVASEIIRNADGSATVVVGSEDWVSRMHWEVALTLRPGAARIEQHVTLFNATPTTNLYWYWTNASVPATDDMQFIYPEREVYPHTHFVWSFPVHDGVDYSWYKNIRHAVSLFGRDVQRNFFGAYYHQSDYGVVHVAGFREVPGKKVWTWGVAGDGLIWTGLLTDHDGPYNEIQAGRYQTQLNYEFMLPRRVESWTEYWYPVRGLGGGFVEASRQLALNARFLPGSGGERAHVEVAFSPTVEMAGARVSVKLGSQVLREFNPTFKPLEPVKFSVPVEDLESAKHNLAVEVRDADGRPLLSWSAAEPIDGNPDFVPTAGKPPLPPKPLEQMTVEELYLHGVDQEKDGRGTAAQEIYQRVLERDPGYVPALLKLAWHAYRAGDFALAETFIARATARDAHDPQVQYAAGVIYRAEKHWTLAQDAFWDCVHFGGAPAPAFAQLGELSIRLKQYQLATLLLGRTLSHNPDDAVARADLAVALRLSGKLSEAEENVNKVLQETPLLPFALSERWRIEAARKSPASSKGAAEWAKPLPADVQNYLEVAAWYRDLGDFEDSDAVLQSAVANFPASGISPLVYYYLAANAREEGHDSQADEYNAKAQSANYVKVFPSRIEDAVVIWEELQHHPIDPHGHYYLGNFLFARGRYDDASRLWSQSLGEGFEYSVLMRNLGVYASQVKNDLAGAAGFYESAVRLDPNEYRYYVDLDEIYFRLNATARRDKLFASAPAAVLDHDTVLVRRALLATQERRYDQALGFLKNHSFKPWEGGAIVRQMFVEANVQKGRHALAAGNLTEAEEAFRQALEYPLNLGVGKPDKPHDEEAYYWLGEALAAQQKADSAREAWREAAKEGNSPGRIGRFGRLNQLFRGLALRRLGQTEEANKILSALTEAATATKATATDLYVAGMLDIVEKREAEARNNLRRAVQLDPEYWQARLELEQLGR